MSLNCCDLRGWFIATVILMAVLPVQTSSAADQSFLVDQFDVAWREIGPDLPSTQSLRDASVFLGRTARGYTGLTDGVATVRTELASLDRQRGVRIDVAGLGALAAGIEKALEAEGMLGARVQAFLQHQSGGSSARFHAWFLADIPLPGLSPNADVPNDLVPVVHMASAYAIVTGIKLKWEGKVPYLPSPRAFLDSIELHVSVNGQAVIVDANSTADVGRLRYDSSLRWSPAAKVSLSEQLAVASQHPEDGGVEPLEIRLQILDRLRPAEDSIAPGIDIFPVAGVTPGTCGLLLAQPRKTILITGDAVATREHLANAQVLPTCWNREIAQDSFAEAIQIADIIIPGRDNLLPGV